MRKGKKKKNHVEVPTTPTLSITQPDCFKKGKKKLGLILQHALYTNKTDITTYTELYKILLYILYTTQDELLIDDVEKFSTKYLPEPNEQKKTFVIHLKNGEKYLYDFTKSVAIRRRVLSNLVIV